MLYLSVFESMEENMTESQVKKLYASWNIVDPEGVKYWTGKSLDSLLKARLEDTIKTCTEVLK